MCNNLYLNVNNSFSAVESPEFAPINMTASTLNNINEASLQAVESAITAYKNSEVMTEQMQLASVSYDERIVLLGGFGAIGMIVLIAVLVIVVILIIAVVGYNV